jgi:hypothetical protein
MCWILKHVCRLVFLVEIHLGHARGIVLRHMYILYCRLVDGGKLE